MTTPYITDKLRGRLLISARPPRVFSIQDTARLGCGCCCHVGFRLDNRPEVATVEHVCSPEHRGMMRFFHLLLRESTMQPLITPLIEVVAQLLVQAERQWEPGCDTLDRATGHGRR